MRIEDYDLIIRLHLAYKQYADKILIPGIKSWNEYNLYRKSKNFVILTEKHRMRYWFSFKDGEFIGQYGALPIDEIVDLSQLVDVAGCFSVDFLIDPEDTKGIVYER